MRRENGRKSFYQWELNQRLIVDEDCTMVQFGNGTMPNALGCEVKEENGIRYAEVPNILLQTAADLHAYAWDEEKTSVVSYSVFAVMPMPKPAQYAYTQTEVKRYDILLKELEEKGAYYIPYQDADGNVTWQKTNDHMPDVPGWSIVGPKGEKGEKGEPGDPGKDGADGQDGKAGIDGKDGKDGYTPVRGEDYFTAEDVALIIEQIRTTEPKYELIETITLTEEATSVVRKVDLQGNAYNFGGVFFRVVIPAASKSAQAIISVMGKNSDGANYYHVYHQVPGGITTTANNIICKVYNDHGMMDYYIQSGKSDATNTTFYKKSNYFKLWKNVISITITAYEAVFPVGTKITIYAIRG